MYEIEMLRRRAGRLTSLQSDTNLNAYLDLHLQPIHLNPDDLLLVDVHELLITTSSQAVHNCATPSCNILVAFETSAKDLSCSKFFHNPGSV